MSVEKFLEQNYIDPKIRKFTDRHMHRGLSKDFRCGGPCRQMFSYSEMTVVKYPNNKQVLRCPACMKKYKVRNSGKHMEKTTDEENNCHNFNFINM